jgi:glucosamine-6-phosphate deaminase
VDIVVAADEADLARRGTELVAGWLRDRPTATVLAALGTTPLGIYRGLAELRRVGRLDTSGVTLVQLDAYLGVDADDRRSLRRWLGEAVAGPLGIPRERVIGLRGDPPDPDAECRAYDAAIATAGGLDVCVLGLGPNGHLGFNEPPSAPDAPTRLVDLAPESIDSNARYWGDRAAVPRRALTAGMTVLLRARRTLLVVAGRRKRPILRRVLTEPPSGALPASLLRAVDGVTLLADRAAWPADIPAESAAAVADG